MAITDFYRAMTKAELWCRLNRWDWPSELGPKPTEREIGRYMMQIVTDIGLKACLREWNKDTMSDYEFENWWSKSGSEQ